MTYRSDLDADIHARLYAAARRMEASPSFAGEYVTVLTEAFAVGVVEKEGYYSGLQIAERVRRGEYRV